MAHPGRDRTSRRAVDLRRISYPVVLFNSYRKSEVIAMATRYGKKASEKVARAMHERKEGTLKSGRSGRRVTSRKQAIAYCSTFRGAQGGREGTRQEPRQIEFGASQVHRWP